MLPPLAAYSLADSDRLLTPALLIYPQVVDANIKATIAMAAGDAGRWRPHIKTSKIPAVIQLLIANGISRFKCSTTLELLMACQAGAADVLLAFPVMGANATRAKEIAANYPKTKFGVLVESPEQAAAWIGTEVGVFVDVNSGMNRTGIEPHHRDEIASLAAALGKQFRGLHFYDGHISAGTSEDRETRAYGGYARLLELVRSLPAKVSEVITSGTPAVPYGLSYPGFRDAEFLHTVSPGTVVFNDMTSLEQLPSYGYQAATLVMATVVSHPQPGVITCDAGHKSVSADAGVPTCAVLGHPDWKPLKPSEEHLPIEVPEQDAPKLGTRIYLLPRHVCPTVNNFDEAIFVAGGKIQSAVPVSARGHESALKLAVA